MPDPPPEPKPPHQLPVLNYVTPSPRMPWVSVGTFPTDFEASLARARLESEGIRTVLQSEGIVGVYTGSGRSQALVLEDDAPKAREILEKIQHEIDARHTKRLAKSAPPCPRCGSANSSPCNTRTLVVAIFVLIVAVVWFLLGLLAIAAIFLVAGLLALSFAFRRRACRDCGRQWTPRDALAPED